MTNFHAGQHVEYYSSTHGIWVKARVQRVRSDGFVCLNVKRRADPLDIRDAELRSASSYSDSESDTDNHSVRSYSSGSDRTDWQESTRREGPSVRHESPTGSIPEPRAHHVSDREPYSWCAVDSDMEPLNGTEELPAGWEAHTSQSTGQIYYLNIVTEESTYDVPRLSALPAGWTHRRSEADGALYFISPDGDSTWDLPRDTRYLPSSNVDIAESVPHNDRERISFKVPFLPIRISIGS